MKKLIVVFRKDGRLFADVPLGWETMTDQQRINWANEYLKTRSDAELVVALSDAPLAPDAVEYCIGNTRFFEETPKTVAIENGDDGDEIVVNSRA